MSYSHSISAIFGSTFATKVLTPDICGVHWSKYAKETALFGRPQSIDIMQQTKNTHGSLEEVH